MLGGENIPTGNFYLTRIVHSFLKFHESDIQKL